MTDPAAGTIACAACGTENDATQKFCLECGAPLAGTCPSCGTPVPANAKFCGECGTSLVPAAPRAKPTPTPVAERRLVSVLFVDLVSFTTLSERRDAEEMRELLTAYFDAARTAIERHGGVVEKFIGDAVMAVWGVPVTHEDDAERAVRAALEVLDAVDALAASTGAPLRARGGVLTGEAATMPGSEREGMVTGDMVNTASRIQSAAEPGSVFVGEGTYRAASRAIAFEEVGELTLKGKEAPVRAWRALRVIAERQGTKRMAVEPPFVGRGEELRLLKDLVHATGREAKARVVSITGIGGIGKSRLSWELEKYLDGLTETLYWHHGRCPAYGDGVTFWALGEMVRMRAGIAETEAARDSRAKLAEAVERYAQDEDERRWLEPRLAFLLGLDERPPGGSEELFAAWRTFFERISETGTVVMVFEDLQWADAGLLDFVESILEWSKSRPILVVTLARPELADRRPGWGASQRSFVGIHLEPLPDGAMRELVRGLVPSAPEEAISKIVARAEGVPLYAVETVRMLADRGDLRLGDRAYELVGDLGDVTIPETLHALIASRLDALPPEDRALLQDAAVLGKSFTLDALGAVSNVERPDLERRLRDLVRKEFLAVEANPRSPERGQYTFIQAIIREVAYAMLSKADRRARHLAVARQLAALDDDELAGAVASHFMEALAATPGGAEADALAEQARAALDRAAARAADLGSPDQALGYAEQALAITPAGSERAALLLSAASAAEDALRREERIAYLREAVEEYRALGDLRGELASMARLVEAFEDENRGADLRATVTEMEARLGDTDDPAARAELDIAAVPLLRQDNDYEEALRRLDRALAHWERTGDQARFRSYIGYKPTLLGNVGRHAEAIALRRGLVAVALEQGDLRMIAQNLIGLGVQLPDESGEAASLSASLEAASVARRGGYGEIELVALGNAVEAAVEAGAWDKADEIVADLRDRNDLPGSTVALLLLNEALLAAYRGDAPAASAALGEVGSSSTQEMANPTIRAWIARISSVVATMGGDPERGYEEGIRAIDEDPEGMNSVLGTSAAGRAALWLGDPARARAALGRSALVRGRWAADARRAIEAGIAALEGRVAEASGVYEDVLDAFLGREDRFAHAFVTADAVAVLPAEAVPEGAVQTARAYLESLGANALLERLPAGEPVS